MNMSGPLASAETGVSAQGVITIFLVLFIILLFKLPGWFWKLLGKKTGVSKKLDKMKKDADKKEKENSDLPADLAPYVVKEDRPETVSRTEIETGSTSLVSEEIEKTQIIDIPNFEDQTTTNLGLDSTDPMDYLNGRTWEAMCRKRKLGGLFFLRHESTPFGVDVHVRFGGALSFPYVQTNLEQIKTGLNLPHDWRMQLKKGESSAFGIVRIITHDPLAEPILWTPSPTTVRLADPLLISRTAYGEDIHIQLKRRLGIFGTSGSGKSCTQRLVAAHVIQAVDADLEIWDFKFGIESQHFEGKAHRVTTVLSGIERVKWLLEVEYPRRAEIMKESRASIWDETSQHPARVIIIDEGNRIIRGFTAAQVKDLATAIEMGRAVGVYFVWATQFPKADNLPTEIRSQLDCRISLLLLSSEESQVVYKDEVNDGWSPHLLTGPGWMFIKDTDHKIPEESKALWLDKEVIPTVPLSGVLSPDSYEASSSDQASVSDDIWEALALSKEPLGISELSRRTGRSKSAVHDALQRMKDSGTVCRTGTDRLSGWCLPLSPEDT